MKNNFCIAPFVNLSTTTDGRARLCCQAKSYDLSVMDYSIEEIWNSTEYKNAREKFKNNEWPDECISCKINEEKGISSRRFLENSRWKHVYSDKLLNEPKIYCYDLRMGHTCNLKCIMCTPMNSSLWVAEKDNFEHLKDHHTHIGHKWASETNLLDDVKSNLSNVQMLYFAGGEPLLIKKHKELILYCIDNNYAKNISLVYDTNATMIDQEWIDIWKNFKSVKIQFSIDGGKEVVEYVRYPVKYSTLINSLNLLKDTNCKVYLQMALGAYNIFEIEKIISLQNEYKCEGINISIVNWPEFMSIDNLSNETKKLIKKRYANCNIPRVREIVENLKLNNNDSSKIRNYFENLDKVRGLEYRNIFKWI